MSLKVSIICLTVVPSSETNSVIGTCTNIIIFFCSKQMFILCILSILLTSDFLIHFNIPMIILSDCLSVAHVRRRSCLLLPLWCTWWPLSLKQVCNELVDLYLWLDLIIILPWHCDINWKKERGNYYQFHQRERLILLKCKCNLNKI